jgi:hypothetical protein
MAVRFARTDMAMLACVGLLGTAGFFGFSAGFNARSGMSAIGLSSMIERDRIDVSATDAVNLRFPSDWAEAPSTAPVAMALASADAGITFLDPRPLYTASVAGIEEQEAAAAPVSVAPAAATIPRPAPARPGHRSNSVLNESQIASIKKRLNLTRDQERYWPAVAAELRKMEYKKDPKSPGSRTAAIDMSNVNMEGLKTAGFPLVMSFNDDQRRELKSLAHLLGLEGVMSSF